MRFLYAALGLFFAMFAYSNLEVYEKINKNNANDLLLYMYQKTGFIFLTDIENPAAFFSWVLLGIPVIIACVMTIMALYHDAISKLFQGEEEIEIYH